MPLKEQTKRVDVPAEAGVEGFMHAVREILGKSNVQEIVMRADGTVSYTRLIDPEREEADNLNVSYDHLAPYEIIRNRPVKAVNCPTSMCANEVIATVISTAVDSGYTPICFVADQSTQLWNWLHFSSDYQQQAKNHLFGYPLHLDKDLDESVLVLCAGVGETRALIDTRVSISVHMNTLSVIDDALEVV